MALYLQMDGINDYIQCPPLTMTSFEVDMNYQSKGTTEYIFDGRTGLTDAIVYNGAYKSGLGKFTGTEGTTYLNGAVILNSSNITKDARIILKAVSNVVFTDNVTFFAKNDATNFGKGLIYNVKIYNGTSLVAHYDMSTGAVNDISGNGNHATLNGGTWLDDGTGGGTTDPGTDGTTAFDTKQIAYVDGTLSGDLRLLLYADQSHATDTRIAIYQDATTTQDTAQILYEMSSVAFDTLQEIFNDGQVGATPFDIRVQLYEDKSASLDTKQSVYDGGLFRYDVAQVIYESNTTVADVKAVIYADSAIKADLLQTIYTDDSLDADTLQRILAEFSEYSEVVRIVLEITQRRSDPLSIAQSHSDTLEIVQRKTIELNL